MWLTILSTAAGTVIALGTIIGGILWILDLKYATKAELKILETKHTELLVAITEIKVLVQGIREYLVANKEEHNQGGA